MNHGRMMNIEQLVEIIVKRYVLMIIDTQHHLFGNAHLKIDEEEKKNVAARNNILNDSSDAFSVCFLQCG